jgi:hypothetical protein
VYPSTIWKILKANEVNCRFHGDGTRLLHEHLYADPPYVFPYNLYNDFPKLIAVFLLTDGYLKKGGGIMLISTDEILQRYFLTLLKEYYDLAPTTKSYMKNGKETIVHSKTVYSQLLNLSPTYNTYPVNCNIEEYLQKLQPSLDFLDFENSELLKESIRIAMSTDGTVNVDFPYNSIYPKLEFSCAHPGLAKEWKRIFKKVGINSFFIKSKITWSKIRGLGIRELKSIQRFAEIGGFIEDVKITGKSKYYQGVTKNNLLNLILKLKDESFHFPRDITTYQKHQILRDKLNLSLIQPINN